MIPRGTPASSAGASFAIIGLGVIAGPLDAAVNVAFPAITAEFALELQAIQWVVIAYLLTYSGLIMVSGRLGDLYGHHRVFRAGLAISIAGFLGCALAPAYGWLLAARVLQGAGMALVLGCGPALALSVYADNERTLVLARFGAVLAIGLTLGPLAGGLLVDAFGWRSVYWARVPLSLAALLLLARVPAPEVLVRGRSFDAPGAALLVTFTCTLLLALSARGAPAALLGAAALAACVLFVRRESRIAEPILSPRLFADARFTYINLCSIAVNFAGFAMFLLGPYWFTRISGLSALAAGMLLACGPAGALLGAVLAAKLVPHRGAYRIALQSAALVVVGLALAAFWGPSTAVAAMAAVLLLQGLGIGTFQVAYSDIVVDALPPQDRGVASSLANLTRTLGVVSAATLLAAFFQGAQADALAAGAAPDAAFVAGFHTAVAWAAGALGLLLAAGLLAPRARGRPPRA